MANDGQAQEVYANRTGSGHSRGPSYGDQAQRPDILDGEVVGDEDIDDEDVDDEDAVIIEEMSVVAADDDVSPVSADDEPGRNQVTSAPAAATGSDAPRHAMPVGAGTPAGNGGTAAGAGATAETNMVGDPEKVHDQWAAIQSTFVDDPRGSVAAAAEFVTETIAALVASAQQCEHALRGEWDRDGVDTEGLRTALRSYRGLLDRLVRL
jgi:hypothetical protein